MAQKFHQVGFIAFGQRGQQLAETLINYLPEYGAPAAVADLRSAPASEPERILSSVMIPMAALGGKVVQTGEWYRSIVGE